MLEFYSAEGALFEGHTVVLVRVATSIASYWPTSSAHVRSMGVY